jgi:hypothetical protein
VGSLCSHHRHRRWAGAEIPRQAREYLENVKGAGGGGGDVRRHGRYAAHFPPVARVALVGGR